MSPSHEVRHQSTPGPKEVGDWFRDTYTSQDHSSRPSSSHTHKRSSHSKSKEHGHSRSRDHGRSNDSNTIKFMKWLAGNHPSVASQSSRSRSSKSSHAHKSRSSSHGHHDDDRKPKHRSSRHGSHHGSRHGHSSKKEGDRPLDPYSSQADLLHGMDRESEQDLPLPSSSSNAHSCSQAAYFEVDANAGFLTEVQDGDEALPGVLSPSGDVIALFPEGAVPLHNPFTKEKLGGSDVKFWEVNFATGESSFHMSAMPNALFEGAEDDVNCGSSRSGLSALSGYVDAFTAKSPPLSPTYECDETVVPSDSVTAVGEKNAAAAHAAMYLARPAYSDDGVPEGTVCPYDSVSVAGDRRSGSQKHKKSHAREGDKRRSKH